MTCVLYLNIHFKSLVFRNHHTSLWTTWLQLKQFFMVLKMKYLTFSEKYLKKTLNLHLGVEILTQNFQFYHIGHVGLS